MGRTAAIVPASTSQRPASLRDAGSTPPRPMPKGGSATAVEARLALTEVLIGCDPGLECAERTVQWLVEYSNARQVLCLGLDLDDKRLYPIASHGFPGSVTATFDVEDRTHPVVS